MMSQLNCSRASSHGAASNSHMCQLPLRRGHARCPHHRSQQILCQASLRTAAAASVEMPPGQQPVPLKTVDDATWDTKYADSYGTLPYGLAALQGPRESMEDFATVVPRARCGFMYAGVFDGHGGHLAADYLSRYLYQTVSDCIDEESYGVAEQCELPEQSAETGVCCPVELYGVLKESFRHADSELLSWLEKESDASEEDKASGATATVAMVRRDKIVVANVGDSRAVLCRNGKAVDLSAEHRVYGRGANVEAEQQRIEDAGGWVTDGRVCDVLAVTRSFGDREFKGDGLQQMLKKGVRVGAWDQEFADSVHFKADPVICDPDVTEISLTEGDEFVLIASDGLWDVMESRQAVSLARADFKRGVDPQKVAAKLANLACQRHTSDNVAVVAIDLRSGEQASTSSNRSEQATTTSTSSRPNPEKNKRSFLGLF